MALLNAVKNGLRIKHLAIIGSADIVKDIIEDFVKQLGFDRKYTDLLRKHFEYRSSQTMNSFSSSVVAKAVDIPVLIIHDENDGEVPVQCAFQIHENLKNSQLVITENLGHRKILGNQKVIKKVVEFIKSKITENVLSH